MFIIHISTSGDVSVCSDNGESLKGSVFEQDLLDCIRSGDCEPACNYIRDTLKPEFRIVAKDSKGNYENRIATDEEKQLACENIYFESDSDFSDESLAETYLIWQGACNFEHETIEQ